MDKSVAFGLFLVWLGGFLMGSAIVFSYHDKIIEPLEDNLSACRQELAEADNTIANITRMMGEYEHNASRLEKWYRACERDQRELRRLLYQAETYGIKQPTTSQLGLLLFVDDTDRYEYTREGEVFVCYDFASRLVGRLQRKGLRACTVYLLFREGVAHAIVAVETSEGVIYIEPQTDTIIRNISLGDNYCDLVGWDCSRHIVKITDCFFGTRTLNKTIPVTASPHNKSVE